jgi:hypothetical protein
MTITPNGRTAYIIAHNRVVPIRVATHTPGKPINAGLGPAAIVFGS